MELKQLEYLVACIECGSYSKASEILYTTQANISKVIFKLEDELGYKLLERSRAGVRPTAEGKILYNNSKEILERTKQIPLRQKANNDNYFNVVSTFDIDFSHNFFNFTKKRMLETEKINFFMGSKEKIIDYVDNGSSGIGFLYTDKFNIDNLKYHLGEKQLELIIIRNAESFLSIG
ncbi:MAG: LysR family transcriptional regulator, partial [Clostridiales bacterium]|nr:LysR family transcriptional regulator [Clostridiales bacterium]